MSAIASTSNELPFFFTAGGEDVFGIVTEPTVAARGVAVILLSGGAFVGATNRNRVSVRLARRLAALGYHAVRMDYHGVGESTGEIPLYRLDRPFVDDLLGAVNFVEEQGVHEFVLLGTTCFGSRTALAAAEQVGGLRAVLLFATPLRDFLNMREFEDLKLLDETPASEYARRAFTGRVLRGLLDSKKRRRYLQIVGAKLRSGAEKVRGWIFREPPGVGAEFASPRFLRPLASLGKRGTPVLLAYGEEDAFYEDLRTAQRARRFFKVLDPQRSSIQVRTVPGSAHGLVTLAVQDAVIDLAEEWLATLDDRGARTA